jgi:hypothetical protein
LIHRGRAIVRESDTLLDIFGAEAVRPLQVDTLALCILLTVCLTFYRSATPSNIQFIWSFAMYTIVKLQPRPPLLRLRT